LKFSAVFLHRVGLIAKEIRQFVLKFWKKKSRWSCKWYENWRFSTTISLYFRNGKRYSHSL